MRILIVKLLLVTITFSGIAQERQNAKPLQGLDSTPRSANALNVRAFGAKGDGKALDSPAINKAIDAAAASGGGTVFFTAGTYRSFSIRLKSNITPYFDRGSTLL